MVKELLALAPQMAFLPDKIGNYSLHIAILHQQNSGVVYELFKAYPDLGSMYDLKTSLLPFMLAAMDNWNNEKDQINVIYQLLREDPHSILGV